MNSTNLYNLTRFKPKDIITEKQAPKPGSFFANKNFDKNGQLEALMQTMTAQVEPDKINLNIRFEKIKT